MADEQTTPENVEPTIPPQEHPVQPTGEQTPAQEMAESGEQPVSGPEGTADSQTAGQDLPAAPPPEATDVPPADETEGFGPNPPADPALAQREAELKRQAVENPPSAEELADPDKPASELPPNVAVGGARVSEQAPNDGLEPADTEFKPAKLTDERGPATVVAQPVRVDGRNRRDDGDALEGHFVKVNGGEHDGQIAAFVSAVEHSQETGYPIRALVRFKDTTYDHEYSVVDYKDLEPTPNYRGG